MTLMVGLINQFVFVLRQQANLHTITGLNAPHSHKPDAPEVCSHINAQIESTPYTADNALYNARELSVSL